VLDPFAGSGSTGLAAHLCRRRFLLIELSRYHCATARARLTALAAKQSAVHASGESNQNQKQPVRAGGRQKESINE
jgi:DNA modification methylase